MDKRPFFASLALHLLPLLLLLNGFGLGGGGNNPRGTNKGNRGSPEKDSREIIANKNRQTKIRTVKLPKEGKTTAKPKEEPKIKECEPYFGGIGITMKGILFEGQISMLVQEIHQGYPAFEAGMLIGDIILNNDEIRGEVGTPVTVYVDRNGQSLRFDMKRARICLKESK